MTVVPSQSGLSCAGCAVLHVSFHVGLENEAFSLRRFFGFNQHVLVCSWSKQPFVTKSQPGKCRGWPRMQRTRFTWRVRSMPCAA